MTPTFAMTIRHDPTLTTQGAVHDAVGRLTDAHKELRHYQNALIDILNTNQDERIETYDTPAMDGDFVSSTDGTRLLWMPEVGRAALNGYQSGDWQWTDAPSPEDALRRYREDEMQP